MSGIEFIDGGKELLDRIEDLWVELNLHHKSVSEHFSNIFDDYIYDKAKEEFLENHTLFVSIAIKDGEDIGYCITGLTGDGKLEFGHILSLFVSKEHRLDGIGSKLFKRSLKWLNNREVFSKDITVVQGNIETVKFYEKHGFKIDTVKMLEEF